MRYVGLRPLSWKCIKCNCDSRNYWFKGYRIIRQFIQNKIVKLNDKLENVITISEFSEKILRNTLRKNVNIERIYNPIDIDKNFKKINPNKNEYYLYVGRISQEKGVDLFCRAVTELNLKGIIVGDGKEKEKLEKQYPNIEFTGWKNKNEVKEYMKGAKTLIFPSRWYEGAPLTVLEAMSIGIPCIVSNCSSAVDYISEEMKEKQIFDVHDIENLKEKILEGQKDIIETSTKMYNHFWKKLYKNDIYILNIIENYEKILLKEN